MLTRFGFLFSLILFSATAGAVIPTVHCGYTRGVPGGLPGGGGRFVDSIKFEEGIDNYFISIDQRSAPGSFMEKLTKKQADFQFYQLRLEFVKVRSDFGETRPSCFFTTKNQFLVNCPFVSKLERAHLRQVEDPNNRPFPIPGSPTPPVLELLDKDLDIQQFTLSTQRVTREFLAGEVIQKEELLRWAVTLAGQDFPFPNGAIGEVNHPIANCGAGELPETPAD